MRLDRSQCGSFVTAAKRRAQSHMLLRILSHLAEIRGLVDLSECIIRAMPTKNSDGCRPPVLSHAGHLFRQHGVQFFRDTGIGGHLGSESVDGMLGTRGRFHHSLSSFTIGPSLVSGHHRVAQPVETRSRRLHGNDSFDDAGGRVEIARIQIDHCLQRRPMRDPGGDINLSGLQQLDHAVEIC